MLFFFRNWRKKRFKAAPVLGLVPGLVDSLMRFLICERHFWIYMPKWIYFQYSAIKTLGPILREISMNLDDFLPTFIAKSM